MVERRQAPKQKILSINRVGAWGKVRYEHKLDCGHSEILPRASSAKRIACTWCVKAQEKEEELRQLVSPQKNSSQILDMDEFRLDVILHVAEYKIEYLPFRTKVIFGDFLIEHGDKIPGAGGVVPARTALMRLKTNCIVNHFHKSSQSSQRVYGTGESTTIRAYSLGCLCELAPDYMEINEWNHGFAILTKIDNLVSVNNYKIEDNTII